MSGRRPRGAAVVDRARATGATTARTITVVGLQQRLGVRIGRPNVLQRGMQRIGVTRGGSWVFSRLLPPVDRFLLRRTGGRLSLPGILAGLPVATLVSTGARTGRRRESPLAVLPLGDDLAVIGTNFAQPSTPGWVANLHAHPRAELRWRGRSAPVVARPAVGDERDLIWAAGRRVFRGFATYPERISGREVRLFVLEEDNARRLP